MTARRQTILSAAALALAAAAAAPNVVAHPGPRVWLNVAGGRVTTYAGAYPPGDPSAYQRSRVFAQPLVDEGDGVWDTDFPGFQMVPGGTIPAQTTFSFTIPGPLLWYDPPDPTHAARYRTVASKFGPAAAPQFDVGNELFQSVQTGGAGPAGASYPAFAYTGSAGDHNHLLYTLLGDGRSASPGPDGVYALPLALSAPGATTSEPFYLLLGKNATAQQLAAAAALAGRSLLLPGDADGDGIVGFADLQKFQNGLGKIAAGAAYPSDGDFDFDGAVGRDDFKILLDHYGQRRFGQDAPLGAGAAAAPDFTGAAGVPEPGALAVVAATAGLTLATRRRVERETNLRNRDGRTHR